MGYISFGLMLIGLGFAFARKLKIAVPILFLAGLFGWEPLLRSS
jgi:VanZ family protein